jgi:hypothetical protein
MHLGLFHCHCHCGYDDGRWSEIMGAISTLPSSRTLDCEWIKDERGIYNVSAQQGRTKAVAEVLLANQQVDKIPFDGFTFDWDLWDTHVNPSLECNLYRKQFVPLHKIEEPSTRAAMAERALARVARKPSLIWMALSQKRDILCDYLDEALTCDK